MNQLSPCPGCQRHVRTAEQSCPFCGQKLELSSLPPPVVPQRRLSRAATFAFGAGVVGATALVSCSDGSEDLGNVMPVYGAPIAGTSSAVGGQPTAGSGGTTGGTAGGTAVGGNGGEGLAAVYGSPPEGGGPPLGEGGAVAIYGGPPAAGAGGEGAAGSAGQPSK